MNHFSIRDLENLTGIKAHTIRIWEQRYSILEPKRTPTNIRYYDADDLKLALRVSLLNKFGYKISRIHRMRSEEMADLIDTISDERFRLQADAIGMLNAMLAMDTAAIDRQLSAHVTRHGIEATMEGLVFEFLEKIGLMWLTDRISSAQEHLVSHVIQRKIAVAIDGLPAPRRDAPAVLLFLPEGEIHDIGLWYAHYLLRKAGLDAVHLGANTPLRDAQSVYALRRPPYVYVHLTVSTGAYDAPHYLQHLCTIFPDSTVLVSGAILQNFQPPSDVSNLRCLYSLEEARDAFAGIAAAV
jgi:DNA-binding transcriptional MerR regulator